MRGQGTVAGAPHALVQVAVEVVVERSRAAARGRTADERRREDAERGNATRSEEHAPERGHEQERHDRWLGERHEIPDERALTGGRPPGERGERDGAAPEQARRRGMRAEGPR